MPTQQSLLEEYEHQLNKEKEKNVAILNCLSQCEQAGESVPHQEIQQALEREKKNASKLVALQNLNKDLLSIAREQCWQFGECVLSSSNESQSEAEEKERIRPKAETTSAEVANISWQHAASLRQAFLYIVPDTVIVRRGAAAQTPGISSEEGAHILKDMVHQLQQVPDTPIVGSQKVWFMEPTHQASTLMVGGNVPHKIGMSYVELEPV